MPASVLCHILSFLPTKQVVATSVLSKRWNPLWRSVPTLNFDLDYNNKSKKKYYRFLQSLYEVILSRDSNQPIQTFSIKCATSHCEQSNVNVWVNAALQRNVEYLDLLLSCTSNINLPSAVFRHRTLAVLKLRGLALKATSSIDLPSLKILHLDLVSFSERRYLAELLSECPLLEDLGYPVNFVIDDQEMDKGIGDDPNPYAKDVIPVFHNLVHIELTYFHYTMNWFDVIELLNHCPKLQILVIDQNFNLDDYEEIDLRYSDSIPKCISLHLKTCLLNNYKGSKGEVRFARYVMRNASILRTIKIFVRAGIVREEKINEFEMLKELSSCTRCSPTCELSFEII
ncbi:F-box/FBD/LRR-repeat protein At1g78750-like [Gastrolobium bilobum]|uniref:F-box/FBD/LRR-repeat protein At1g78750-like n=1 Tax=Gastrolobium bilobum TaxID=150636 RepID=UPI002AB1BFDF|nr:F-box/FBD/LRR-repeat protein At1g78750-like [Gastrolobium bilobum]